MMVLTPFSLLATLQYNYSHKNIGNGDSYLSAELLRISSKFNQYSNDRMVIVE